MTALNSRRKICVLWVEGLSDTDGDFAGGVAADDEGDDDDGSRLASSFQHDAWEGGPSQPLCQFGNAAEDLSFLGRGPQKRCLCKLVALVVAATCCKGCCTQIAFSWRGRERERERERDKQRAA